MPPAPPQKPNPLLELAVTIVAPSLILMQFSDKAWLGERWALLLALALPLGWGIWDGLRRRKLNALSLVGIVSTLLTGGLGLLQLDAHWFAIKEGAVPALMGLVIAGSAWTRHPLIHALVFDADLMDVERIRQRLAEQRNVEAFETRLRQATLLLAGVFLLTAAASYTLARWLVTSSMGSDSFNQQLGRLTLLSWPLVALPSMLLMLGLMLWLGRCARELTGMSLQDMFRQHH